MSPLNLPWEAQYEEMQNRMDDLRVEIIRIIDIDNDLRQQFREKENELTQKQMRLRDLQMRFEDLPREPGHLQEIDELQQDTIRIVEELNDIEREIDILQRQKRELEQELNRRENEAEQFARDNRNQQHQN